MMRSPNPQRLLLQGGYEQQHVIDAEYSAGRPGWNGRGRKLTDRERGARPARSEPRTDAAW